MKFDEQFFQSLLSAAFTVQEYNDRQIADSATTRAAETAVPMSCVGNTGKQDSGIAKREDGAEPEMEDEPAVATSGQAERYMPNFYFDLLKSIEAEKSDAQPAEMKGDVQGNENAKGTEQVTENTSTKVNVDFLRIIEAGESDENAAEVVLNRKKGGREGTELDADHQNASQVSEPEPQGQHNTGQLEVRVCDSQVDNHLLQSALQQVLQATHATTAAIALGHDGKLTCRDSVGESASEIRAMIDKGSGFTGLCASVGTMQFCTNTMLDPRVDAQACHKLGARAAVVVPFFHRDQLLGLIAAFSRRPYAFGVRELEALQELGEKFSAHLKIKDVSEDHRKRSSAPGQV